MDPFRRRRSVRDGCDRLPRGPGGNLGVGQSTYRPYASGPTFTASACLSAQPARTCRDAHGEAAAPRPRATRRESPRRRPVAFAERSSRSGGHPILDGAGPSDASDLLARAQQRFDTGDIEGALQSARAAIRAGGGAPAHLLAGRALGKQNQLQEAERELAVAVRLDPTNAFAAQRLREVRERIRATIAPPE